MAPLFYSRCEACGEVDPLPVLSFSSARACAQCGAPRLPFEAPVELTDPRQLDALDQGPLPLLVAYGATWCGATHQMEVSLETLAKRERGTLVVLRVDVDAHPALADRAAVRSLPTLAWRQGGQEKGRHSGALHPLELTGWTLAQRAPAATLDR